MSEAPDLVAQLAASHMGVEPPAPAAPAAPPAAAPQGQAEAPPTPTEEAVEAGSPKDEADEMKESPVVYDVAGRKLTPQQIQGTFDRYRDLNFKHSQLADLHQVADIAQKLGLGNNPKEVALAFAQMLKEKANQPQTMGQDGQQKAGLPEDDELSKWEEENAAKLPPGYRELTQHLKGIAGNQSQLMDLMRAAIGKSGAVAGQAADQAVQAKQQRQALMQAQIKHNLESLSQRVGLDPEHAKDFMMFAGERGYGLEDFLDPNLTASVMQDFKNNINSPEMERLKQIAQRRQAFTGSVNAGPSSSGGTQPAPAGGANARLNELVDAAMARKGG